MSLPARLYHAAGTIAAPGLRVMLQKRLGRGKEIAERLPERFGITALPRPPGRLVWLHAASVGEAMSVFPVIDALDCAVLLTTGTVTSASLAAQRLGNHARHQFVPLDVPAWAERFLAHGRADCAVFVESELWPNMLGAIDAHGIPRLLINARLSARSAARWRYLPGMVARLLGGFRYIHAQSPEDAHNLESLGLTDLKTWGNLKFFAPALPVDGNALAALRAALPGPVWLAASTHPGEEAIVRQAHDILRREIPDLVTIIVPRHPARGAEIAVLTNAPRRSENATPVPGRLYIADTLGELGLFYRLAPFAFVGGSLIAHGGQNVIEPARLGRPVIVGPHTGNFIEPVRLLESAGALVRITDAQTLAQAAAAWLAAAKEAAKAGAAAASVFAATGDLPVRLAALILETAL
jgi:3-deoxy-D-manno-octulosonic-acid transferase